MGATTKQTATIYGKQSFLMKAAMSFSILYFSKAWCHENYEKLLPLLILRYSRARHAFFAQIFAFRESTIDDGNQPTLVDEYIEPDCDVKIAPWCTCHKMPVWHSRWHLAAYPLPCQHSWSQPGIQGEFLFNIVSPWEPIGMPANHTPIEWFFYILLYSLTHLAVSHGLKMDELERSEGRWLWAKRLQIRHGSTTESPFKAMRFSWNFDDTYSDTVYNQ